PSLSRFFSHARDRNRRMSYSQTSVVERQNPLVPYLLASEQPPEDVIEKKSQVNKQFMETARITDAVSVLHFPGESHSKLEVEGRCYTFLSVVADTRAERQERGCREGYSLDQRTQNIGKKGSHIPDN